MRLSWKLDKYRTDRPDEWTMDDFARQARLLELALIAAMDQTDERESLEVLEERAAQALY